MDGADIRAARKAAGLNQTDLAERAGISRDAVSYWETRTGYPPRGWALERMAKVLGLDLKDFRTPLPARGDEVLHAGLRHNHTSTRTREDGVLSGSDRLRALDQKEHEKQKRWLEEKARRVAARFRVVCCATTRKGTSCRNMSEAGRKRCKFHGGMSTGARTAEGKERIAEAQRKRWSQYRAERC